MPGVTGAPAACHRCDGHANADRDLAERFCSRLESEAGQRMQKRSCQDRRRRGVKACGLGVWTADGSMGETAADLASVLSL